MAKQQNIDLSTKTTHDLQVLFLQKAEASYKIKGDEQQGWIGPNIRAAIADEAWSVWNIAKARPDFNPHLIVQNLNQGMAHRSIELSNNALTKDIHDFGKKFSGSHPLSFNHFDVNNRSTCFWFATYGNKEMVEYCVRNGALINVVDKVGNSLTQIITNAGWTDIIALANQGPATDPVWKILLDTVSLQDGNVVFHKEAKEKEAAGAIQKLVNADTTTEMPDCSISNLISSKNMLPYYFACQIKSGLIAHKILNAGTIKADHSDSNGWGHFHWAINLPELPNAKGKMMQMDLLKEKGCNVNVLDKASLTPLHHTEYLSLETAAKLLELGADVNIQDSKGFTPITLACAKSYEYKNKNAAAASKQAADMACHILKTSLDAGKNIDFSVRDNGQKAPIGHWLLEVYCNDASRNDIFTGLKAKGYNINMVDGNNKTLMDWSVEYKWKEAVKVLHECDAQVTLKHMQMVSNDNDFTTFLQPLCTKSIITDFADLALTGANAGGDNTDGLYD
jgi:ankyrin repeat protein